MFEYINTAQEMKFSIKDFFSKCDQIRSFLRIRSHLLMKSLMENFLFCAVEIEGPQIRANLVRIKARRPVKSTYLSQVLFKSTFTFTSYIRNIHPLIN